MESPELPAAPATPSAPNTDRSWHRRVFKNTFTRQGRRVVLKNWSVKIQRQGRRRTFSLLSTTRAAAACEAREIYEMILEHGWEFANQYHQLRKGPQATMSSSNTLQQQPMARAGVAYWKQRLIEPKYLEAKLTPGKEWSVRIEQGGNYCYFPLGTENRDAAAARAMAVYQTVLEQGWEAASRQYAREITVAIFWAVSPVAVTYTTIFTFPEKSPENILPAPAPGPEQQGRTTVALIEPDTRLQAPLAYWLNHQPGFACQEVWNTAESALENWHNRPADLILVNRVQSGLKAVDLVDKIKARWPKVPIFTYGIYEDSDQIFIRLSGVRTGYIFRRRTPRELLEPVWGAFRQKSPTADQVLAEVKNYFQSFFGGETPGRENLAMANLTDREQKVLNYVSKGYLDKEIANALGISVWTVHNHLKNTYEKLNVHTRMEAALKYLQK